MASPVLGMFQWNAFTLGSSTTTSCPVDIEGPTVENVLLGLSVTDPVHNPCVIVSGPIFQCLQDVELDLIPGLSLRSL